MSNDPLEPAVSWASGYPIDVLDIHIQASDRSATLTFKTDDATEALHLERPDPLSNLVGAIDAWELRIIDRNVEEPNDLEFGRFRLDFHDEDGVTGELICDAFTVESVGCPP